MHKLFLRSNLNVSHDNLRIDKKEIPWDYPTRWSFISNTFVPQIYGEKRVNCHHDNDNMTSSWFYFQACSIFYRYALTIFTTSISFFIWKRKLQYFGHSMHEDLSIMIIKMYILISSIRLVKETRYTLMLIP